MHSLEQLQTIISAEIDKYVEQIKEENLYLPVKYIINIGGKRMRPALMLFSCDMFGGKIEEAIAPAIGVEVFHNFTLMHDDIMDEAPLRRGHQTVHHKWNTSNAILSGDVMFVMGYQLMCKVRHEILPEVLSVFSQTATEVCEGQQLDMDFEQRNDVTIQEYIEMIRLKTSVLLAGSLKIGGIIAGASKTDVDNIYNFGEHIGIAFQLQDDLLDAYGEAAKFGKQVGGDILANKKTYLLLKAFEKAAPNQIKELHDLAANGYSHPQDKINATIDIYNQLEIRKETEQIMNKYFDSAMKFLHAVNVAAERKAQMISFAEKLLIREY
jgi:geranylgeranyl diphosphate synthase, type II